MFSLRSKALFFLFPFTIFANGADVFVENVENVAKKSKPIEVFKMKESPYNENAIIRRMYAENNLIGAKHPLVLNVADFPISVSLPNRPEWLKGFRENSNGSVILIWVYAENGYQKRFYLTKDDTLSFIEDKTYFKDKFKKYFTSKDLDGLSACEVGVTSILVNGYGESLKTPKATKTLEVFYKEKTAKNPKIKEGMDAPRLVYNEPYGNFQANAPIMCDFYVYNTEIGSDACTVELYIDGVLEEILYEWAPYKLMNLAPGRHEVELVLVGKDKKPILNPFGRQKNVILVGN
jgi:hypothetical protein